jgi:hypothetical protein
VELQISRFEDVPNETWDRWTGLLQDGTYLHSSFWLDYCHATLAPGDCLSFAVLDSHEEIQAICPLGISESECDGVAFKEASWGGAPLALPAIRRVLPTQRRRLVRSVFEVFHSEMKERGVGRSFLRRHPVSNVVLQNGGPSTGEVEALSAGYFGNAQNTIVLDLDLSVEELNGGMTREQRKHLYQSQRAGLTVREFRGESPELDQVHGLYRLAHVESAGRLTRPGRSFDYMAEAAKNGQASLFAAFINDIPISFLYCGEYGKFAFGWSQVNVGEYEKEFSPRHFLEWSAILTYKQRGFAYYELGARWYGPQIYKIPSPKELSIAAFKERFGGQLWLDMTFERYFDVDLFRRRYDSAMREFLDSDYFPSQVARFEG